jgi:hypothetical protein
MAIVKVQTYISLKGQRRSMHLYMRPMYNTSIVLDGKELINLGKI